MTKAAKRSAGGAKRRGPPEVAVIGAGPAGLIAAERLAAAGAAVTVYDRMPSPARKFLFAGRGGLNLTHAEPAPALLGRYRPLAAPLRTAIEAFSPDDLRGWAHGLGEETFVGSSGRVFPKSFKATPLLRAWLARLEALGVAFRFRHRWTGWNGVGALRLTTPDGEREVPRPDATLLALGGASWPRLGSDGGWVAILAARGIAITPLAPSNAAIAVAWSDTFRERFHGAPLKRIAVSIAGETRRGEAVVTRTGLEGGPVYALSGPIRAALARGEAATIRLDLRPDLPLEALARRLGAGKASESIANRLRKAGLPPVTRALVREPSGRPPPGDAADLARAVKSLPLPVAGFAGFERAISTAGGVAWTALNDGFELEACPGVFVAGEMLDADAPTGGYLLQAAFATGSAAARAIARRLGIAAEDN